MQHTFTALEVFSLLTHPCPSLNPWPPLLWFCFLLFSFVFFCSTMSIVLFSPKGNIVEIIQYLAFSGLFLSFSIMHLSFLYVFHVLIAHLFLVNHTALRRCTTDHLSIYVLKATWLSVPSCFHEQRKYLWKWRSDTRESWIWDFCALTKKKKKKKKKQCDCRSLDY